jgi:hypothetical protein
MIPTTEMLIASETQVGLLSFRRELQKVPLQVPQPVDAVRLEQTGLVG